jgi:translocation and assembly module TamA
MHEWMRAAPPLAFLGLAAALAGAGCGGEAAEGRPWVHTVSIHGNRNLKASTIKDHIALEGRSWLPWSPKHYLDPVTLEVDRRRVEAIYRAHGYFFARVTNVEVKHRGKDSVDVRITVDEGPATRIRKLAVRGLEELPARDRRYVLAQLPLRRGAVFVHQDYLASRGVIGARLRQRGYAFAEVRGEAEVDRPRQTADVALQVDVGPRANFGAVRIDRQGKTRGADWRLKRRAQLDYGQRFDPEKLEAARARIFAVGLYSSVRVDYLRDPQHPGFANVVITVRPSPPNELRLGGGFGFEQDRQEIHLRVQYTRRDFLGGLRTLRVRLLPAYVVFPALWKIDRQGPAGTLDATLTQPDWLARDLALRGTVGFDLGIDYAFRYWGPRGAVGLTYPLFGGRLVFSGSYNLQQLNFFDTAPNLLEDPTLSRNFFGFVNPYLLSYLIEDALLDLRDRPLDPHRGLYFDLNLEEGASWLGSNFNYQRILPDFRGYLSAGKRVVLAGRLQWGHIYTLGGEASPITRRFYAGGADSHRGFNYNRLSPQVPSGSSLPPIPVGGDELFLIQGEVRVRLFRILGSDLGVVAFVDAGDVPQRGFGIDFTQLNVAVGGGLRYRTIIGTVRADLGVRLNRLEPFQPDGRQNPDPGQRFAFHLSIGEAF